MHTDTSGGKQQLNSVSASLQTGSTHGSYRDISKHDSAADV